MIYEMSHKKRLGCQLLAERGESVNRMDTIDMVWVIPYESYGMTHIKMGNYASAKPIKILVQVPRVTLFSSIIFLKLFVLFFIKKINIYHQS